MTHIRLISSVVSKYLSMRLKHGRISREKKIRDILFIIVDTRRRG